MMKEENIQLYKDVYAELVAKGYMTKDEFRQRVKGHNVYHVYRALDSLNLFTYDDEMQIEIKGKKQTITVVKPC